MTDQSPSFPTPEPATSPAATGAALPLDDYLCFAVYAAGLAFNRVYKPLLDGLGLTYPQYLVIVALRERDDQTVGELGARLFLESNTLTPLIKRLETAGLVRRVRDSADERVVRVSLTDQGRRIAAEATCIPEQVFEAADMPIADLAQLKEGLAMLGAHLRDHARGRD